MTYLAQNKTLVGEAGLESAHPFTYPAADENVPFPCWPGSGFFDHFKAFIQMLLSWADPVFC